MAPWSRKGGVGWSGASAHRTWDARTRCLEAPTPRPHYAWVMPTAPVRALAALVVTLLLAGCAGEPAASFDPTGPCSTDGSAVGAYPDLEARIPTSYEGVGPGRLDS